MGSTKTLVVLILIIFCLAILPSLSYAQGSVIGREQLLTPTGAVASIAPANTPAQSFSTGGTNTFILPVSNTAVSVRVYVTNNTANACAGAFTIQMWAASDPQVSSFNLSLANWQTVPLQNPAGGISQSVTLSIPASGAVYVSSTVISSTKVTIQLFNSTNGCATTNLEAISVTSQVAVTSPLVSLNTGPNGFNPGNASNVQGIQPVGSPLSGINPLAIGGNDISGNAQFYGICFGGQGGFHCDGGMPIGMRQTAGGTFTTQVTPQSAIDGPLVVENYVAAGAEGGTLHQLVKASPTQQNCSGTSGCAGLLVSDSGYFLQTTLTSFATNSTIPLWSTASAGNSVIQTCHFSVIATNNSGTTPTLDVFIQDSPDNSTWDDRVHFTQVATGTSAQVAGIAGTSANETPRVRANLTIAASTTVAGPIDAFGRAVLNLGGTTPNYTATVTVNCK